MIDVLNNKFDYFNWVQMDRKYVTKETFLFTLVTKNAKKH